MKNFTFKVLIVACFLIANGNIKAQDLIDLTGMANDSILADTLPFVPDGSVVLLGPGETYNTGGFDFYDKSIEFNSSNPNAEEKPILYCDSNFGLVDSSAAANISYLRFKNLHVTGEYSGDYIMNVDANGTIGEFTVENCDVYSMRGILRVKGGEGTVDKYTMMNCTVDSVRNYGILAIDKNSWMCNDIVVKNSTFKNMEYFLISRNNSNSVLVENCTFDEMPEGGRPWFRWREEGQDNVLNGITLRNIIYSHAWDINGAETTVTDGFDGLGATTWTIENCYATNEYSNVGEDTIPGFPTAFYAGTADDLWTDRANNDYTFKDESFAGIGNAGDPRWAPTSNIIDLTGMANDSILADTLPFVTDGAVILLGPGETYNTGGFDFYDKSIEFNSSNPDAEEKPILYCDSNFGLADSSAAANISYLRFKNLHVTGEYSGDYIMNVDANGTIGEFTIENCDVYSLRGIIRVKGGEGTLDKYTMDNCTVDSIRNYGILAIDKNSWMCNDIVVKNSTFKNMEYFLISRNNSNSVLVENCTMDEMPEGGRPLFRWREEGQDNVLNGITLRNIIYSHAWDINGAGTTVTDGFDGLGATTWTIENCYATNEYSNEGEDAIPGFPTFVYEGGADDLWTDRANFDYTFKDEAFVGKGTAGDPRWADMSTNTDLFSTDTDFDIYPNPANGQVYIKVSEPTTVAIFNIAGNMMIQKTVNTSRESIDISMLPAGLYIVRASDESAAARKLIVR